MAKRSRKSTGITAKETATPLIVDRRLLEDIRGLIESAKSRFAQTADAALTDLPPRRLPGAKLHEAIRMAREQIAVRERVGSGVVWEVEDKVGKSGEAGFVSDDRWVWGYSGTVWGWEFGGGRNIYSCE
ncbi:MAG: hypothetical protein DRI32_03595 [Chloroflexi bacterium]|nr:MAG: hypothetical protein DRI32_03595 [Chloroflexota bacterium]